MTTIAGARAELVAELVAGEIDTSSTLGRVAPPCALVFGGGIGDMRMIGRGQVPMGFRIVLVAGSFDADASAEKLDALTLVALGVLRELAGWQIGPVGIDTIRRIGGTSQYLTRDVTATRMVDIS